MFDLLERHPGVVVLHDFYLSGALNWMSALGYAPESFTRALYDSHGFSALLSDKRSSRGATIAAFPCNMAVLRGSTGVIVHSNHSIELVRTWYGDGAPALLRRVPFLPHPPESTDRKAARDRTELPQEALVVCSFDCVAPEKLSVRLLEAWLNSPLAEDASCYLIFVGENRGDYGRQLSERVASSGVSSRIRIAGYAEEPRYRDYLAAADFAVQLRTGSRGETSGTIFDCLSRSVPLIVNAHGSFAELPQDVVKKLDDDFTDADLSTALVRLGKDVSLRQALAARGLSYVGSAHHPERIAELYRDIIEELYLASPQTSEERLVQAIARAPVPATATEADLAAVATAIAVNRERFQLPQILIDVTYLAKVGRPTPIQNELSAIFTAFMIDPPAGYRVEPVRVVADGYLYARRFACEWLGLSNDDLGDDPVETGCRDVFIGLQSAPDNGSLPKSWLLAQHRRGMRIVFAPIGSRPTFSSTELGAIRAIGEVADAVICSSSTAAEELYARLPEAELQRVQPLSLGFLKTEGVRSSALAATPQEESSLAAANIRAQLLDMVFGNRWYRFWPDGATASPSSTVNCCSLQRASTPPEPSAESTSSGL
jgi:glycosyltransferase involved in cell wall biosynthesis